MNKGKILKLCIKLVLVQCILLILNFNLQQINNSKLIKKIFSPKFLNNYLQLRINSIIKIKIKNNHNNNNNNKY
jgi:hypothetical protein